MTLAETAADPDPQRLGAGVSDRLVFQALYEAVLEREVGEDLLDLYLRTLDSGWPAAAIIASIAGSEEAQAVRERNLRGNPPIPPWERPILLDPTTFADLDAAAFFALLYGAVLERDASETELGHYKTELERGTPLPHLIASIVESEEARAVREEAVEAATPPEVIEPEGVDEAESPVIMRSHEAYSIRTDDVLATIAQVYRAAGREPPALDEALGRFEHFRRGADLSAVVADVTPAPVPAVEPEAAILEPREQVEYVIRILYQDILKRPPAPQEIAVWYDMFQSTGRLSNVVIAIAESAEAQNVRRGAAPSDVSSGVLVQMAYEIILGRGASAFEVDHFRDRMERSGLSVESLTASFFQDSMKRRLAVETPNTENDPSQAYLFGSEGVVDAEVWDTRPRLEPREGAVPANLFRMKRTKGPVVSIITSLYRGGDYIEPFLENITSQTIFKDHCELIIIDANSPENEGEVIERYAERFPNIVYRRFESRIGIYEAWNIGCALAKGRFLTNANLDDCRRADSLELQASVLDSLPFVDVTYQDVLYSFEPNISFEEIEAHGLRAKLPVISHYNLMEFNSPHNGPMWRKTLHAEVGVFNESYKSAADFDFWLRCLIKGKTFYKLNEPHVAYYVNPQGLSTRADTRGVVEANAISRTLYRQIVSPLLTLSDADFLAKVGPVSAEVADSHRRYDILQAALRAHGAGQTGAAA
ncbi:glycosyltransferase [Brevundimonas goettingensis]|uniref:Glycosyltransferase n=1 Tax=Brevundimonas goettingensis TaxID=2774190 RepID=A0A975C1I7_9CAUL|nr:glycosyltransferase [Brevundimonas goettingensis]QTC91187.1 glycosyltransferase [Brevundimonas goettingensis]